MPKSARKWHPRKEPSLQIRILKHIALKGTLSQSDAPKIFRRSHSTISEALNIMRKKRSLIEFTTPPDFKSGERHRKYYKLTADGLIAFIDQNPIPYEFWIALMWHCSLNSEDIISKNQLDKYYDLFIKKYVGYSFPLRSCFFLTDSFNNLFKKWCSTYDSSECNTPGTVSYFKHPETLQAYQVFQCLLENRAVTLERIVQLTGLTQIQVTKTIEDYGITSQNAFSHFSDLFQSTYQSDRMVDVTVTYLNHLVIVPVIEKGAQGELCYNKYQRYELSLLGILLVLATLSLRRQKTEMRERVSISAEEHYNLIASNYQDKLPLIFGKWNLVKEALKRDSYPSIFDYLFLDKSEILSLSVLLGGNKEIYDNIKSAALNTISKFSRVHDDCISAIDSNDCPDDFANSAHNQFVQDKLSEIEKSLTYSDIESFAKHMISKRPKLNSPHVSLIFKDLPVWKVHKIFLNDNEDKFDFEDDLLSIESTLADELSFLFYVGLLRENNHKASFYPLTIGFISYPSNIYPKDFLAQIIRSDDDIRKHMLEWIKQAAAYQSLALDKMNKICSELERK